MATRPRLLDLFCGAGGCAVGYQRAGFHVTGVDHTDQPRYAGDEFVKADALEYLRDYRWQFDAVHASPPCQGYSRMRHLPWLKGRKYQMLIPPTLKLLDDTSQPWVVENVEDAWPAFPGRYVVTLCGTMFGLKVYRHRLFASNVMLLSPPHPRHKAVIGPGRMLNDRAKPSTDGWVSLPSKETFADSRARTKAKGIVRVAGHETTAAVAADALGIDWMVRRELAQAIPPAYAEFVGRQLLAVLGA